MESIGSAPILLHSSVFSRLAAMLGCWAEDRGVERTELMQSSKGNLVLDSTPALVACNIIALVACKAVPRAIAAAKCGRRDQWSTEMLPELLCSISDYLPVVDFLSFRNVLRDWRLAASGRSEMLHFSRGKPWLLFYGLDDQDDTCYFYNDSHPKCCTLRLPGLRGATCVDSMNGWILARRGSQLSFYSPFSMETIELATACPDSDGNQVYTFEGSPYCTTYVVSRREQSIVEIGSCRFGDKKWRTEMIDLGGEWKVGSLILANTSFTIAGNVTDTYTEKSLLVYSMTHKIW